MNAIMSRIRSVLPHRADLAATLRHPRRNLIAGATVAVVALPLALGFGISSGLGAQAGLATAIIAGAIAAIFGGSHLQVSGPTGAMTVVLVPIMHTHGATGVLTVGIIAGIILIALALARAGKYMAYIPTPVIEGFTIGIACVIGLQQIPAALGITQPQGDTVTAIAFDSARQALHQPQWIPIAIAVGVAAIMLIGNRWRPTIPFSLFAVAAATIITHTTNLDTARIGHIPAGLPIPTITFIDPHTIPVLIGPALAVAALAALESLLSAAVADGMTINQKHQPDKELFGQGLANLASPLFGGVPATGAIARTAVNVRSGATTRLASLFHAVVLAVIVFAAAPLVSAIPLAALAGVLLATAIRMIEIGTIRAIAKVTRGDAIVLVLTAAATLILDLVQAVILGFIVAGAVALRAVARSTVLEQVPLNDDMDDHSDEEIELLSHHIVAYRLDGPLFFAAAHRFLLELSEIHHTAIVILRMSRISTVDASGALILSDAIEKLERRGIVVYVSGIREHHHQSLTSVPAISRLTSDGHVFATTTDAITQARRHLQEHGVIPPDEKPRQQPHTDPISFLP